MTDRSAYDGGSAGLEVSAAVAAVVGEQWAAFGEPGTWCTGSERVAIAEVARAARRQVSGSGSAPVPAQVADGTWVPPAVIRTNP